MEIGPGGVHCQTVAYVTFSILVQQYECHCIVKWPSQSSVILALHYTEVQGDEVILIGTEAVEFKPEAQLVSKPTCVEGRTT